MNKGKAEKGYTSGCWQWLKSKDWDDSKGGITKTTKFALFKMKYKPTKL